MPFQKGNKYGVGNKYRVGKTPWNKGKKGKPNPIKGLTKYTSKLVARIAEKRKGQIRKDLLGNTFAKGHHPPKGFNEGNIPWNKGLTKDNNTIIANTSKKISNTKTNNPKSKWSEERKISFSNRMKGHPSRKWTEEERKKHSERLALTRKWYSISGSELKVKQALVEMGYIEEFDFLHSKGLKLLNGRYKRPDFRFESKKIILEFDGKHWHTDVEKDTIRNKMYEELGYKVFCINEDYLNYNLKETLNRILEEV